MDIVGRKKYITPYKQIRIYVIRKRIRKRLRVNKESYHGSMFSEKTGGEKFLLEAPSLKSVSIMALLFTTASGQDAARTMPCTEKLLSFVREFSSELEIVSLEFMWSWELFFAATTKCFVLEEKAWKSPESWTGDDKQVAGALQDSGRRSNALKWEFSKVKRNWFKES